MKEAAQDFRKAVIKVNVIVGQNPSGDGSKSLQYNINIYLYYTIEKMTNTSYKLTNYDIDLFDQNAT